MKFLERFQFSTEPSNTDITEPYLKQHKIAVTEVHLKTLRVGEESDMSITCVKNACNVTETLLRDVVCHMSLRVDLKFFANITTDICLVACMMVEVLKTLQGWDAELDTAFSALEKLSDTLQQAGCVTSKAISENIPFRLLKFYHNMNRTERLRNELREAVETYAKHWDIQLSKDIDDFAQIQDLILQAIMARKSSTVQRSLSNPSLNSGSAAADGAHNILESQRECAQPEHVVVSPVNESQSVSEVPSTSARSARLSRDLLPVPSAPTRPSSAPPFDSTRRTSSPSISTVSGTISYTAISGNFRETRSGSVTNNNNSNNTRTVNIRGQFNRS